MITYAFAKESASPLKKALHNPWCRFYFGLRRVSLAEYILVLRALFPLLLQMVKCTTAIALTACIRRWVTTWTKGKWSLCISHLMLLLEMTTYWHCI